MVSRNKHLGLTAARVAPDPQPALDYPAPPGCPKCRDMGFTLKPEHDPDPRSKGIPAGILYKHGIPCTCPAGEQFIREREAFGPTGELEHRPAVFAPPQSQMQDPATWEPPAWADPPPRRVPVMRPDTPRITAEDLAAMLLERKERQ